MHDGLIQKRPVLTDVRSFHCKDVPGAANAIGVLAGWPCQAGQLKTALRSVTSGRG